MIKPKRLSAAASLVLAAVMAGAAAGPAAAAQAGGGAGTPSAVGGPQLAGRGLVVNYPAHGKKTLPKVPASAYVIADAGTGAVLAARDPHGLYRPASTLKVLTAITLMPVLPPHATVTASHRAAVVTPSKVGLIAGDRYQVSDLFKALLMISANDAAIALAQATGSYSRAIAMMNSEAHHLHAFDTVAGTPNGLEAAGQRVSAYDEALFARRALAIPEFMRDEAIRVTTFPRRPHHKPVKLWNQNTMLENYPGDLGGKIGWTTQAGATFIGWARRGGHTLIVTLLHGKPLTELISATKLLNWGFAMDGKVKPAGKLVKPLPPATAKPRKQHVRARAVAHQPSAGTAVGLVPVAAGLGTLALAVIASGSALLVIRRGRRARTRRVR